MKKRTATKVLFMLLAAMMIFAAGCGDDGADDPNLGVYVAKSAEMSGFKVGIEDLYKDGFIIELRKKGKAHLEADGEDGGTIKWTLDGNKFHAEGGGAVLDGTLSDGVMVLENVMDSGMTLYLECDDIIAATGKNENSEDEDKSESDEGKNTFSKKESGLNEENIGLGNGSDPDEAGENAESSDAVDYDFDEALKLVNDYEGFIVFKEGAHCYDHDFNGITGDAFARIVIDENKQPLVFMRHIYGESVNIEHVKGEFKDDGRLTLVGMMGTDDGPQEWMAIISPPVGNEPICVSAVLTSDYETPLFNFYMKPLDSKWDYSYVDDEITEKDFNAYVNNMGVVTTGLLEDELENNQEFWSENSKNSKNSKVKNDPIKMITDELPDPELLHMYK